MGYQLQKIEAPVRGNEASDGGPPMSDRLGGNDRLFIQEDGAKEKNLLGTGAPTSLAFPCKCCCHVLRCSHPSVVLTAGH